MIKEMRNMVQRELHQWRASPQSSVQIINETNVHRFFKSTVVDTGMRYALSTGNWGIKSIGSFTNIRQGVAQVLNRLSYLSTLSHLRRLNTLWKRVVSWYSHENWIIRNLGWFVPPKPQKVVRSVW